MGRRSKGHDLQVLTGSLWEDVGHGECARCATHRRLYRPLLQPELCVCAPCSQVFAISSLPNQEPEGYEFLSEEILN